MAELLHAHNPAREQRSAANQRLLNMPKQLAESNLAVAEKECAWLVSIYSAGSNSFTGILHWTEWEDNRAFIIEHLLAQAYLWSYAQVFRAEVTFALMCVHWSQGRQHNVEPLLLFLWKWFIFSEAGVTLWEARTLQKRKIKQLCQ